MSNSEKYVGEQQHNEQHVEPVPHAGGKDQGEVIVDKDAAGYTDYHVVIDEKTNKRLRRMINKRVLPWMMAAYLMQALDKGAIGTSSIMGLQADTGMKGQDYALTFHVLFGAEKATRQTTVFWVGLIVGEFPANRLSQILPLGKFMSVSLVLWGVCLMIMGFMRNYKAILGLRTLLGLLESVVGPVLLAISVMWYKSSEQPFVVNGYQTMLGLSTIISGLLGYGFYHVQGHPLYGWQYMFIMISCISILVGILMGFFLPDSPPRAKCFSEADKLLMVERVRHNDQGIKNPVWIRSQFIESLWDPYIYLLFSLTLLNTLVVGGLGTFQNLLINKAFGFGVLDSELLNLPLGALSVLLYVGGAWLVTRTHQTFLVILGLVVPNVVGTIVLITVTPSSDTKAGLLVAFYVMQCYQAQNPLIFQMCSRNIAGQTKRVVAYAATFIGWAGGNAISPQIFQSAWAPRYLNSLYIHLGLYGLMVIDILITRTLLVRRNKRKEAFAMSLGGTQNQHLHAFEDLTDIANPDFRYVL